MGGGALSSNVSKLGSKEVSKKLCNFTLAPLGRGIKGEGLKVEGKCARKSRKVAFTLAEVLITLGIIGVVASLTLPSVIMNYQKKQTVVELKKVYAELQNVIKLSEIDNGPMSEWDFPEKCAHVDPEGAKPFIEKYYLPYFKNAKLVKSPYKVSIGALHFVKYWVALDNGTIFGLHPCVDNEYIWLFVDLNGVKEPNKVGRDIFVFDAYKYDGVGQNKYKLSFWGSYWDRNSVENLKNNNVYGCNKTNTDTLKNFHCGRLIELNNWEIPADYPW